MASIKNKALCLENITLKVLFKGFLFTKVNIFVFYDIIHILKCHIVGKKHMSFYLLTEM